MAAAAWLDTVRLARRLQRPHAGGPIPEGVGFVGLQQAVVRVRAAGDGPATIVFAADPPNLVEHYDELFALLTPHLRVVCFELPGFGFSYPRRGFSFTLEDQVAAIAQLLERRCPRPSTLAFSCGSAYMALELAARRPELIAGLIVIQAPSWSEELRWAARIDRHRLIRTPVLGQAVMALAPERIAAGWYRAAVADPDRVPAFLGPALDGFTQGACYCLGSAFQATFTGHREFAKVHKPALVIWGSRDRTHRRSDPRSALNSLPGGTLVEFEDAGHFPELERPDRFAELALPFTLGTRPRDGGASVRRGLPRTRGA